MKNKNKNWKGAQRNCLEMADGSGNATAAEHGEAPPREIDAAAVSLRIIIKVLKNKQASLSLQNI